MLYITGADGTAEMERLKTFLKKRALLMGTLAVAVPLVFIVYWQYRSLTTLQRTLPVFRKEVMRDYLRTVSTDVYTFYHDNAMDLLSLPPDGLPVRSGGTIEVKDNRALTALFKPVAAHFAQKAMPSAKRYFLFVDTLQGGSAQAVVLFYNPSTRSMEPDPLAMELQAINVACAPYLIYIRGGAKITPMPVGIDRNPWYPLIVKPQLDSSGRVVAIAGTVIDPEYFLNNILPPALDKHLREFFPDDYSDVQVAVDDEENTVLSGNSEVTDENAETYQRFGFLFQRWFLIIRMRGIT